MKEANKETNLFRFSAIQQKIPVFALLLGLVIATALFTSSALAADPGHGASRIGPGTFESGDFVFPNNLNVTQNFSANGSTFFVDSGTGRVGIKTYTPSTGLHINATINITDDGSGDGDMSEIYLGSLGGWIAGWDSAGDQELDICSGDDWASCFEIYDQEHWLWTSEGKYMYFQPEGWDVLYLGHQVASVGTQSPAPTTLYVESMNASLPVSMIRGAGSQAKNLTEWQNSTPATVAYVQPDGTIVSLKDVQVNGVSVCLSNGTNCGGSGNVSGSGTANRLTYWSDGDTLAADDDLFYNATSNSIGIGTSTPGADIEIRKIDPVIELTDTQSVMIGAIGPTLLFNVSASNAKGAGIKFWRMGSLKWFVGMGDDVTSHDFSIIPNSGLVDDSVFNIDPDGLVKIQNYVNSHQGGLLLQHNYGTDSQTRYARIKMGHFNNTEPPVTLIYGGSHNDTGITLNEMNIGGGTSDENSVTSINMYAGHNGTHRGGVNTMQVTENLVTVNGSVVISDGSVPSGVMTEDWDKLLVYEDSGSQWSESYFGAKVPGLGQGAGSEMAFGFGNSSDVWNTVYGAGFWVDNETDSGSRDFWIYDYMTDEYLFYSDGDSNVGIGTSSPSQKLHVVGNANITGNYTWVNGSKACTEDNGLCGSGLDGSGTANRLTYWSDADTLAADDDLFYNATSNRLGIGTTAPSQELDVNGSGHFSGTVFADNFSSNSPLRLQTGGTTRMYVDDTYGLVGVGSASPDAFMDVNITDPSKKGLVVRKAGSQSVNIQEWQNESGSALTVVDESGNVGIGTDDPSARLHVNGTSNIGGTLNMLPEDICNQEGCPGYGSNKLRFNTSHWEGKDQYEYETSYEMYANVSELFYLDYLPGSGERYHRLSIDDTGMVAINSLPNSSYRLFVNGNQLIGAYLTFANALQSRPNENGPAIYATNNISTSYPFNQTPGNLVIQGSSETNRDIVFMSGTGKKVSMVINGSGSIGIGTTSPSQKLDVNGSGNFSGDDARLWVNGSEVCTEGNGLCLVNGSSIWVNGTYLSIKDGYAKTIAVDNVKTNNPSFYIGTGGASASGTYAIALGYATLAQGLSSIAIGDVAWSSQDYCIAMGKETNCLNNYSNVIGYRSQSWGDHSSVFGNNNAINSDASYNMVVGDNIESYGDYALLYGYDITLSSNKDSDILAIGRDITIADKDNYAQIGSATYPYNGVWYESLNVTSELYENGSRVCTEDNGLCGSGLTGAGTENYYAMWDGSDNLTTGNLVNVATGVNVTGTLYASNVSSNSPLQLQTGGTTRVFINDSTGNVGVGTSSPNATLHIVDGNASAISQVIQKAPSQTANLIEFRESNGNQTSYIDEKGRVYIGKKSTYDNLWSGSMSFSEIKYDSEDPDNESIGFVAGTIENDDWDQYNLVELWTQKGPSNRYAYMGGDTGVGENENYFYILSDSYNTTNNDRTEMVLSSNIGRASLSIRGGTYTGTYSMLDINRDDADILTLKSDGKLGLGTATPSQKLDVAGNVNITGNYTWVNGSRVCTEDNNFCGSGLTGAGTENYTARWTDSDTLGIGVLYDDGTKVGIGTTSPSAKLQVGNGSNVDNVKFFALPGDITGTPIDRLFYWNSNKSALAISGNLSPFDYDNLNDSMMGEYSFARGYAAANGSYATSVGFLGGASGNFSYARGNLAIAEGVSSTAIGGSGAMGCGASAEGHYSSATGDCVTAEGDFSFVHGVWSSAHGVRSGTIGYGLQNFGNYSYLIGRMYGAAEVDPNEYLYDNNVFALRGLNLSVDNETFFVDQSGNKVGIGTYLPSQKLDVNGSGNFSGVDARLWINGSEVCTEDNGLCGSGISGSGAVNRVTFWSGADSIDSHENFTWDGTKLALGGNITFTRSGGNYISGYGGGLLIDSDLHIEGGNCFAGDTLINIPAGYAKISDLKKGDRVLAFDEKTGEQSTVHIIDIYARNESAYYLLNNNLKVTAMHPFYTTRGWIIASDLEIGDILYTIDGNITLDANEHVEDEIEVWNLHVEYPNTFYAEDILVHNKGASGGNLFLTGGGATAGGDVIIMPGDGTSTDGVVNISGVSDLNIYLDRGGYIYSTDSYVSFSNPASTAGFDIDNGSADIFADTGKSIIFWGDGYSEELGRFNAGGDFIVDTDTLFVNASSEKTGIGTTTPSQKLHVEGNANVTGTLYASNVSSNSPLRLQTGGTTRMYIDDTTGDVNITSGNLTVAGTIKDTSGTSRIKFEDGNVIITLG
ncbi:hypothetical protein JW968_07560 [Candidatus Woesearchaeota archaeon]|nr:hypothetical protein [Candidatus Woesearchaeota archaeon]